MVMSSQHGPLSGPRVCGELPGPRSAELLARQNRRESSARVYLRHLPIAIADAAGGFVRDLDGNVFIDFLTGAGALPLGHSHPELVAAVTEQVSRFSHGLDFPTPAKDAFTTAQLSMLPAAMRGRVKVHFCGPTGANAMGGNCLYGTKVMVPIDGGVRKGVGLLGSPPFEIPRSVHRDHTFDQLRMGMNSVAAWRPRTGTTLSPSASSCW